MSIDWWSLSKAGEILYRDKGHLGKLEKGKGIISEALRYTSDRDLMVDVGAHIGYMGKHGADHFQRVHCFEPAADCFEVLSKNLCQYSNVTLHNVAVGPCLGMCTLYNDPDRPYSHPSRFVVPGDDGSVRMVALDELEEIKGRGLLKIDVEGFEQQVLIGAESYIRTYRPTILMETHNKVWAANHPYKGHHTEAERWLMRHGYKVAKRIAPDTIFIYAS